MKIDKLSIDGNKNSIEISDKIVGAKINNKLISNVLYKKMKLLVLLQKYMHKKVLVMLDMQVKKLLFSLEEV